MRIDSASSIEPLLEFESIKSRGPALDDGSFGDPFWRWTIVFAALSVIFATYPLWLSFLIPEKIAGINALVYIVFTSVWFVIAYRAWQSFHDITHFPQPLLRALPVIRNRRFLHLVVVPCHSQTIEAIFASLGSLLIQDDPASLLVVVAFEASTKDLLRKEQAVHHNFHQRFGHFMITIQRPNHLREIPGSCSNKNFALHEAFRYIRVNGLNRDEKCAIIVTSCEEETIFHPNYFCTLEKVYNAQNPEFNVAPKNVVWQAPLFFNCLHSPHSLVDYADREPYFFTHVLGVLQSMLILGALVPLDLHPVAVYSYPLELGLCAGFINPRYAADDVLTKVRWMCKMEENIKIALLPVPCVVLPGKEEGLWAHYQRWYHAVQRLVGGAAEAFHFFLAHWSGKPFFGGIVWCSTFFSFYALFLCASGVFALLAYAHWPWVHFPVITSTAEVDFSLGVCGLIYLGIQYVICAIAFLVEYRAQSLMTVRPQVSRCRTLLHWVLAPPTLLWLSIVGLYSLVEMAVRGKYPPPIPARSKRPSRSDSLLPTRESLQHQQQQQPQHQYIREEFAGFESIHGDRSVSSSMDDPMRYASPDSLDHSVMCKLPEKLCFGDYSVDPQSVMLIKSPLE